MKAEMSFEVEWPPVARRLNSAFRYRKIPPAMAEDLVQETGLRLFEIWDKVDPHRDLWPLALTIALNILRDHLRTEARRHRITNPDELVDDDTERVALARVELAQVHEALPQLTSAQRTALLAELSPDINRPENSSALKMLRMRARRRLRALIDGASGLVASIELGATRFSRLGTTPVGDQLAPYLSVAAGVLCAAGLSGLSDPALATTEWGARTGVESQENSADQPASFARSLARGYRSFDGEWFVNLDAVAVAGESLDSSRNEVRGQRPRVTTRPKDHRHSVGHPNGTTAPVPTHESEASVGPDGYRVEGKVRAGAAGHDAEALISTDSGSRKPEGGCGRESPTGSCSPASSASQARARARAELDEKGIELGVGKKPTW